MGRRASTSQLEVKHANFSAIKSPSGSRGASPAASPRASSDVSPNRRLSEGAPVKDVGLSREAYSKARNLLVAKRSSMEGSEEEEHGDHPGGFQRVGKALGIGLSQGLVNRRGSAKNQGLMKSLMAAISKEKILNRISELGLDEQVSEMLCEMYQGMIELLIDDYEPLEGALGALLDEAVTGSQDMESLIDALREAVTGSLMEVMNKQEPFGAQISKAQELLLDKVVDAAQGMASEIAYTMRMRGGGKKQRNSAPFASASLTSSLNLGDSLSQRVVSSAGIPNSHRAEGANSSDNANSSGTKRGAEAAHQFKKTVRNMFMMNAIGGSGPHFHTERRAEHRKHHQPGAHGSDDEDDEGRTDDTHKVQNRQHRQHHDTGNEKHADSPASFEGLSPQSGSNSDTSRQRPNTVALETEEQNVAESPSHSPSTKKSGAQSYGMPPSSGSGLSSPSRSISTISPKSSKARSELLQSLNPFGVSGDSEDMSPEQEAQEEPRNKEDETSAFLGDDGLVHVRTSASRKEVLNRLLEDSDQALPVEQARSKQNVTAPTASDKDIFNRQPKRSKGQGGHLVQGQSGRKLWSDIAKGKSIKSEQGAGGLYIGAGASNGGIQGRKGGLRNWDSKLSRHDKALPKIDAFRPGASGSGEALSDMEADIDIFDQQGFDWETLRVRLLREGIKLKIPPELLHKKGMKSQEQSQARLEEVQADDHEAAFREGMARLDESSKDLEASLSGLRRDSSGKSLHGTSPRLFDGTHADQFSVQPVSASCNATLHRAWKSQDPVELEEVYQKRAAQWTTSGANGGFPSSSKVPSLALVPLLGRRGRQRRRNQWRNEAKEEPTSGSRRLKHPILPFRSTCFDFSSDRLLPEILTFPMVTEDFVESVYSLSLEHSRASWSDTNTLIESPAKPIQTTKRGRASKSLQNFHKHFKSVMP